jgi:hypothetical protein
MTRTRLVLVATASFAGSAWAGPGRDKRIEFQEKQRPFRIKYKLSDAAALAKYPAADLFLGPEKVVSPGDVAVLALEGKAAKGSLFVFNCDDVQVVSVKHSAKAVTVKARVGAFALPRTCSLIVLTPVSVASLEIPSLESKLRCQSAQRDLTG